MIYKLFFSVFIFMINLVVVQVSLCHAEETSTGLLQVTAPDNFVPGHEIKYEETLSPDWKVNWDIARSLYRDKKYPEALVQYEILFTQKKNIDEARWEYVTLLMYLKRWDNAKGELEKLLATEPESINYRLAMAEVSLEGGNLDGALAHYSQLYGQQISDTERVKVLEGLVKAYELRSQKAEAAVLLAQLILLVPRDRVLLLKQATLELELDNVVKAGELGRKLEQSWPQDVAVLSFQAVVEGRLNHKDNASTFWQKVIALDPDNAEANSHLTAYYFENENWAMSFNHLEPLIKNMPNDVDLLIRAADLNMRLDRTDRALTYYEYGLTVDPLNKDVLEGKTRAEKILAEDLLALVENDGGKKLWQDVVQVAPDCAGVYREIAILLRNKGKIDALIEVLTLLNKQVPGDQQVYEELALLLVQQGQLDQLSSLQKSRSDMKNPENNK